MHWKHRWTALSQPLCTSWFDFFMLGLLLIIGFFYLRNDFYWSVGYVGGAPYGDAEFWWHGAIHVAQGIFQNNPGKGYRPGYFLLTGLTLPVLGSVFHQFYHYFLIVFLSLSLGFYFVLRQLLGRWAAMISVATLIFNPFTAEWLSTSTTDGLGLLLNLAALSCLVTGLNKGNTGGISRNWLIAFGIFFSLSTLTRPLMTPFFGIVILTILCTQKSLSFTKRLKIAASVSIAFCLPLLLWTGVQKIMINQWTISTNDASAFYAASDPHIQVWNPSMYEAIEKLAATRYNIPLDQRLINRTFWVETIKNYLKYYRYHLRRLPQHIWEIAKFSPKKATHGTDRWKKTGLFLFSIGMSLWFLFQRRYARFSIFSILILGLTFLPLFVPIITLAGAVLALRPRNEDRRQPGMFLLSSYWFTGILALYLVGGTWGPPMGAAFDLNALGYRLGTQVFFVGDILAVYFFVWFAFSPFNRQILSTQANHPLYSWWHSFIFRSSALTGKIILGGFLWIAFLIITVYVVGSSQVIHRVYTRLYAPTVPYPSLSPVMQWYKNNSVHSDIIQVSGTPEGNFDANAYALIKETKAHDLIFSGTVSPFIWNLPGQQRAMFLVYIQKKEQPITMGQGVILEAAENMDIKNWNGARGAFIIRQIPNHHNDSNLPYYLTTPTLRAFIPLEQDGKSFSLTKAVSFPLSKNATQLETTKELQFQNAEVTWSQNSGEIPYQRRFFVAPKSRDNKNPRPKGRGIFPNDNFACSGNPRGQRPSVSEHMLTEGNPTRKVPRQAAGNQVQLLLKIKEQRKPTTLHFSYSWESSSKKIPTFPTYYDIKVEISHHGLIEKQQILLKRRELILSQNNNPIKDVEINVPYDASTITIYFDHLLPGSGIWLYEFNLLAGKKG